MVTDRKANTHSVERASERSVVHLGSGSANYWLSFVSDPATVVFLLFWEVFLLRTSVLGVTVSYGVGLVSWSLLEYVFHRWIYHQGHTAAHAGHTKHHAAPAELLAMPWYLITAFLASVWYVCAYRLHLHGVLSVMAGVTTGFVCYGIVHHLLHHGHGKHRWYRQLRAYHCIHHQCPDVNFGVTSRLWDQVFRTTYRHKRTSTPPRTARA